MKNKVYWQNTDTLPRIIQPLIRWYKSQERERALPWRDDVTPYHTWISEIMLQQTRAVAVIPYYERFLAALPDVASLAACPDDTLMKLWQGLGYYSRARNLKKAAVVIEEQYDGQLPYDFASLLSLPGIGRYTAGAIASIAMGLPSPAVDGNVLRVVSRLTMSNVDVTSLAARKELEALLAPCYPSGKDAGALTQAFMDLGATVCLPHGAPHCLHCPLARLCLAHSEHAELAFPPPKKKTPRKQEKLTVFLLRDGDRIALHKRPEKGLLAGLWELPHTTGHLSSDEARLFLIKHGFDVKSLQALPSAHHVFSHVEWHMQGFDVTLNASTGTIVAENNAPLIWATLTELTKTYGIPSAFQYFLPHEI